MNYWLIHNGVKLGPMSLEQVRAMHLAPQTPVWRTGMPDWVTAADIPELLDTLAMPHVPPTPQQTAMNTMPAPQPEAPGPMPSTYLAWSIIVTLLCCIPLGIAAIVYSSQVETRYRNGDYNGARRASDNAQLLIIASIVAGIISLPFQFIWALL